MINQVNITELRKIFCHGTSLSRCFISYSIIYIIFNYIYIIYIDYTGCENQISRLDIKNYTKKSSTGVKCEVLKKVSMNITFSGIRNRVIVKIGANFKEQYAASFYRS